MAGSPIQKSGITDECPKIWISVAITGVRSGGLISNFSTPSRMCASVCRV